MAVTNFHKIIMFFTFFCSFADFSSSFSFPSKKESPQVALVYFPSRNQIQRKQRCMMFYSLCSLKDDGHRFTILTPRRPTARPLGRSADITDTAGVTHRLYTVWLRDRTGDGQTDTWYYMYIRAKWLKFQSEISSEISLPNVNLEISER